MSRGPGRWQRVLLDALGRYGVIPVGVLAYNHLGRKPSRPVLVAVRRAARRLAEDGKARAIYLGQCRRCGELSERWDCPACSGGCTWVLVLTPPHDATFRTLMTTHRHLPGWLSVASGPLPSEATLSDTPGGAA